MNAFTDQKIQGKYLSGDFSKGEFRILKHNNRVTFFSFKRGSSFIIVNELTFYFIFG